MEIFGALFGMHFFLVVGVTGTLIMLLLLRVPLLNRLILWLRPVSILLLGLSIINIFLAAVIGPCVLWSALDKTYALTRYYLFLLGLPSLIIFLATSKWKRRHTPDLIINFLIIVATVAISGFVSIFEQVMASEKLYGIDGYGYESPANVCVKRPYLPPEIVTEPQQTGLTANLAMFFLVDKSRSTAFEGQLELERQSVREFISQMNPDDLVSVVGFDDTPFVVIQLAKVGEVLPVLDYRLNNLVAMGKTNLLSSLAHVCRMMSEIKVTQTQIAILSNGRMPISDNEYRDAVQCITQKGGEVNTIGIGDDPEEALLYALSLYGKGVFFKSTNSTEVVAKLNAHFKKRERYR